MASPFSIFRKNQKAMMVALCVFVMFMFTIGAIIQQIQQSGSRGSRDPVMVTTTKFGKLRMGEVGSLYQQRVRLLAFLNQWKYEALRTIRQEVEKSSAAKPEDGKEQAMGDIFKRLFVDAAERGNLQLAAQAANAVIKSDPKSAEAQLMQGFFQISNFINELGQTTQRGVVDRWLLTSEAKRLGMVETEDMVDAFLVDLGGKALVGRIPTTIANMKREHYSENELIGALKDELLARRLQRLSMPNLIALAPPAQRWEFFTRLNRYATAEVAVVPVESFVNQVPAPSDAQLKEFFEKHKQAEPNPDSPVPGFREPARIEVQYVKADYAAFLKSVTDKEINDQYDQDRAYYDRSNERSLPGAGAEKKTEPKKVPAKEPEKEGSEKRTAEKTSAVAANSPFRLASFAEDKKTGEDKTTEDKTTEDKKTEEKKTADAAKTAEEQKTVSEKQSAEKKPEEKAAGPDIKTAPVPEAPQKSLTPEMKERIRGDVAADKITKAMTKVAAVMDEYRTKWADYEAEKAINQAGKPPALPNFTELTQQYPGLSLEKTPAVSFVELRRRDVGKSTVALQDESGRTMDTVPAAMYVFRMKPHQTKESNAAEGLDRYLFWRTDKEQASRVPEFDDLGVREKVLHAWKMIEARKLAQEKADTLKAEAEKAGRQPLKDVFAGRPGVTVTRTGEFSWLTRGKLRQEDEDVVPYPTPEIDGVEGIPGVKFLQTVFGLREGQVGAAMNQGETDAYVIRAVKFRPSDAELLKDFEERPFTKYASAGAAEQNQIVAAWRKQLEADAGLEWKRQPDQERGRSEEPEGEEE